MQTGGTEKYDIYLTNSSEQFDTSTILCYCTDSKMSMLSSTHTQVLIRIAAEPSRFVTLLVPLAKKYPAGAFQKCATDTDLTCLNPYQKGGM